MRRLIAMVLLALLAMSASPAFADSETAEGKNTGTGGQVVAGQGGTRPGSPPTTTNPSAGSGGGGSNSSRWECTYFSLTDANEAEPAEPSTLQAGDRVFLSCFDPATGDFALGDEMIWDPAQPVPQVSPEALARYASAQLTLPLPAPQTSPPSDRLQTVGLLTWLHVTNFAGDQRTATAGAVSATVYAEPVEVRWDMGNGDTVSCGDAGAVYGTTDSTNCSYLFINRSTGLAGGVFDGGVTITWRVRWDSNIGQTGDLGTVSRTTPIAWTVVEYQALIR
ncbi:MAG: hypothetical protein HYX32_11970 [Actinobacteria bacterium]|nr:hypothetical protein [Actinomycetota bacterium]